MKRLAIRLDLDAIESKIKAGHSSKISLNFSNWTLSGIVKKMINPNSKERAGSHEIHMLMQKECSI